MASYDEFGIVRLALAVVAGLVLAYLGASPYHGLQPIDPNFSSLRWAMMRLGGSFSFLRLEFTIRSGSRSEKVYFCLIGASSSESRCYRCQHSFDGSKASSMKPHQARVCK
ncbi:hypothetical protein ISN44_As06g002930 [Arabidopsis suecica]|uniref:Uncharacterized protein n=1 Tax=Arabidopsis suecica TaxID=45249 RepID=A0A8T1YE84_ARASU|nr:hypothetical protein ISN44_As12g000340 [Arabidopsis suecica]KAG7548373.1 hypothetical protein ISN44_As12g035650 [Arabidopsis suecica]KAG7595733.1 hypothetical protein ISN44_As06g002930 [Arabidopsis suecica]